MTKHVVCTGFFLAWQSLPLIATGCSAVPAETKPQVLATTGMIADLVRNIASADVQVIQLMGPGVDPHLYKPKPQDLRNLERAHLIFYNGLHLEGRMVELLENHPRARSVTRAIPRDKLLFERGQPDPHVWFDVQLWISAMETIAEDLAAQWPDQAVVFRQRAKSYRAELLGLDEEIRRAIERIPPERRVLVTAHDAFRYFGRAYGLEVRGLQGISTASEASLRELEELTELIVRRRIPAVFVESSVPPDAVNRLLEKAQARGQPVRRAPGELFSDAMGEPGTPEGTYPGMMRHNVRLIVEALAGPRDSTDRPSTP